MKALTICQPWAWLIIHGPKRVENRTWYTGHRGPLAIHAGKNRQWLSACEDPELRRRVPALPSSEDFQDSGVFGAVIGTVELEACLRKGDLLWRFDCFAEGPWCWVLANPKPLIHPVPARGRLGLWNIPDHAGQSI